MAVPIRVTIDDAIVIKYVGGDLGELILTTLFRCINESFILRPEEFSVQPWSIAFKYICAVLVGHFIKNWVEIGTRNHIIQMA